VPKIAVPINEHQSVAATALERKCVSDQDAAITSKHYDELVLPMGKVKVVGEGY
jgi:hypothetical protein